MVTVILTEGAVRDIASLPSDIVARVDRLVERLLLWPHVSGVKRLKGRLAGHYRLRTGDYRLQFRVEQVRKVLKVEKTAKGKKIIEEQEVTETRVIVERAGHRDGFYEE